MQYLVKKSKSGLGRRSKLRLIRKGFSVASEEKEGETYSSVCFHKKQHVIFSSMLKLCGIS